MLTDPKNEGRWVLLATSNVLVVRGGESVDIVGVPMAHAGNRRPLVWRGMPKAGVRLACTLREAP